MTMKMDVSDLVWIEIVFQWFHNKQAWQIRWTVVKITFIIRNSKNSWVAMGALSNALSDHHPCKVCRGLQAALIQVAGLKIIYVKLHPLEADCNWLIDVSFV